MEYKLKKSKSSSYSVTIPSELVERIIELLSNVDCTCIWSPIDNQYIKVNDVPKDIVRELVLATKLKKL